MERMTDLFKFLQMTRSQPQYGYAIAGIPKSELSDLAQHHYLVAIIAWKLAKLLNGQGAKINIQKVLEIALMHDLGELFGGDLSYFYSRANPLAREAAKKFEDENVKYLAEYFEEDASEVKANINSFEVKDCDEALVAQCADKIECIHFKVYYGFCGETDIPTNKLTLLKYAERFRDEAARKEMTQFIEKWANELPGKSLIDIMTEQIKEY